MIHRLLVISLFVFIFSGVTDLCHAQLGEAPYERMFNIPVLQLEKFAKELGISDTQLEQIRKIRLNTMKKIIPMRADAEVKELELRESLVPREPDVDTLFKLTEEIGAIRIAIAKEWLMATLEMKKILTQEQMDRLLGAMEKFRKRFHNQKMEQMRKNFPDRDN